MTNNIPLKPTPQALVVDDDLILLMGASTILEDAGYSTLEAPTADRAFGILEQHQAEIDLLVTDVRMPGKMDGLALAHGTASRWPHILIIVVSEHRVLTLDELPPGAKFISKPFGLSNVKRALSELSAPGYSPDPASPSRSAHP